MLFLGDCFKGETGNTAMQRENQYFLQRTLKDKRKLFSVGDHEGTGVGCA